MVNILFREEAIKNFLSKSRNEAAKEQEKGKEARNNAKNQPA